jgi:hypothetical protein
MIVDPPFCAECLVGAGPQVSAEVKALRQWCESQLKRLSVDEGKV